MHVAQFTTSTCGVHLCMLPMHSAWGRAGLFGFWSMEGYLVHHRSVAPWDPGVGWRTEQVDWRRKEASRPDFRWGNPPGPWDHGIGFVPQVPALHQKPDRPRQQATLTTGRCQLSVNGSWCTGICMSHSLDEIDKTPQDNLFWCDPTPSDFIRSNPEWSCIAVCRTHS